MNFDIQQTLETTKLLSFLLLEVFKHLMYIFISFPDTLRTSFVEYCDRYFVGYFAGHCEVYFVVATFKS